MADIPQQSFALAIDGLFGIGLARPLAGRYAQIIDTINALACPVLALDVPSGLDADTGRVMGVAVKATRTATFIALKPGLLTLDGPDHCGAIDVCPLGLAWDDTDGQRIAPRLFRAHLKPRARRAWPAPRCWPAVPPCSSAPAASMSACSNASPSTRCNPS